MAPYGKVFDSIFGSSIMESDVETRYIWMCMIIAADKEGFVDETIPALARRFNVSESCMHDAINCFMSPDASSRTPDQNGRRIEPIRESFGWKIINYDYYRNLRDDEQRREYMREYMRNYRENQKKSEPLTPVNNGKQQLAHTDTDTDTDTDKRHTERNPDIKKFIDHYHNTFLERFNEKPMIDGGKDGKIIKSLLGTYEIDLLKELLDKFFNSTDEFILRSGYTIGVFKSQINKLIAGLKVDPKTASRFITIKQWETNDGK